MIYAGIGYDKGRDFRKQESPSCTDNAINRNQKQVQHQSNHSAGSCAEEAQILIFRPNQDHTIVAAEQCYGNPAHHNFQGRDAGHKVVSINQIYHIKGKTDPYQGVKNSAPGGVNKKCANKKFQVLDAVP